MIIKPFTPRTEDIEELKRLAALTSISGQQRAAIEKELKLVSAGDQSEAQAAYELDVQFRDAKNHVVLHGVRLKVGDDIAQIDHLVLNRLLDVHVIETKSVAGGIAINEYGEFTGFFNRQPIAMPSPIAQNARHCLILERARKAGQFRLPKRLGVVLPLKTTPIVLINNKNRIKRPKKNLPELAQVMKVEKFSKYYWAEMDKWSSPHIAWRAVGRETLYDIARSIAEAHVPITFNWAARFGIEEPEAPVSPTCESCGATLEPKEVNWCKMNTKAFEGRLLCREHQPTVPSRWKKRAVTPEEGSENV